jgi:p-hydroxybenzoate 3-monooxygenase
VIGHLLARAGIDSVIVESRTREYVESRVRAGVLEPDTVEVLRDLGVAGRLDREALVHEGVYLQFDGRRHRIDLTALTGRSITVYGQQEVVKDLITGRLERGDPIHFGTEVTAVDRFDGETGRERVRVICSTDGHDETFECDFVIGCDGFYSATRRSLPPGAFTTYAEEFPFGWLGILADVAPSSDELIYAFSDRGFALHSLRSPAVSRFYLQVDPAEDLVNWPDERIWSELQLRLAAPGWTLHEGPIFEKSITPMRSFVTEPMAFGNLYLAGDAAHIVPPTGAKGLNLAVADVVVLAQAVERWYRTGDRTGLDAYSDTCLRRIWRAQDFSTTLTALMHLDPRDSAFGRKVQRARQSYMCSSPAMATSLAENYVGLPYDWEYA